MTPLQRIMFLQGNKCFFCERALLKAEASVEHLVPVSAGGTGHPDNLVACCKALNSLFGSMSVKDKMRALLNQSGKFVCPKGAASIEKNEPSIEPVKCEMTVQPTEKGKQWTEAEEQRLTEDFDAGMTVPELAKKLQRGVGGIQGRLIKLGKMRQSDYKQYPPLAP